MCGYFYIGFIDFMFAGKTLTDYTSFFSSYDLEKMSAYSCIILKTNEIISSNLSDQTKFRLNKINKTKDYFNSEIQERKAMNQKPSKYIAAFDYIDKILIVLSAKIGGVSIISFASVIEVPARIECASLTIVVSLTIGIIKKDLQITRNQKKKT